METNRAETDEIEIDLGEIFGLFLHRIWIILAAGLFAATIGLVISRFLIAPVYESATKIYILNKQDSSTVSYSDVQVGTQLTKDYAELVQSRFVLEEVIQELDLDLSYEELKDKLSVSTPTDTRILAITVEDHSPVAAMNMANAIRETASVHITNVMDIKAVNIVETANLPMKKAGPSVLKWTVIAGILGAFLVCVIVFVIYIMDDTIKSSEDVEKYLHLSTLALIPIVEDEETATRNRAKRKRKKKIRQAAGKLPFLNTADKESKKRSTELSTDGADTP
ncbi:MAG: Wzz/FepE/Etk N-terminal domain-containing protein [Lachnospiraceae bacterium]|nr:Wzz/FepE/Etk N-terminal domain-containing protein [Lachnospiraceae bacterium]